MEYRNFDHSGLVVSPLCLGAMAQTIKAHAESRGMTAGTFALRWLLNNEIITSVLAGPRTMEHWDGYLAALDGDFTDEDEALIDTLVVSGHPSTPGYNDPQYAILGRPAITGAEPAGEIS